MYFVLFDGNEISFSFV